MNRRDLLLQEMGIKQWQLRRPEALKGVVNISVADNIKLIIVAEQTLSVQEPFIQDVLRSIAINVKDCLLIDFSQVDHLQTTTPVHYWLLSQNQQKIDRTLSHFSQVTSLWQSPDLPLLKQNGKEKRHLWQQIQTAFHSEE
ncbi:DNA polymerase III subunit psi [Pasteurellaceae bacterium 22721_9_1]